MFKKKTKSYDVEKLRPFTYDRYRHRTPSHAKPSPPPKVDWHRWVPRHWVMWSIAVLLALFVTSYLTGRMPVRMATYIDCVPLRLAQGWYKQLCKYQVNVKELIKLKEDLRHLDTQPLVDRYEDMEDLVRECRAMANSVLPSDTRYRSLNVCADKASLEFERSKCDLSKLIWELLEAKKEDDELNTSAVRLKMGEEKWSAKAAKSKQRLHEAEDGIVSYPKALDKAISRIKSLYRNGGGHK